MSRTNCASALEAFEAKNASEGNELEAAGLSTNGVGGG
jgi:hypothetical protein